MRKSYEECKEELEELFNSGKIDKIFYENEINKINKKIQKKQEVEKSIKFEKNKKRITVISIIVILIVTIFSFLLINSRRSITCRTI
ncbi:MAG: hypothetical protein IKL55_06635 [Clostridia bacterium]|nr:hypothetical protein [Clostridia bacterium]